MDGVPTNVYKVMDRDRRLTGYKRGQTDKAEAPDGFELNNSWRVRIVSSKLVAVANHMYR